MKNRASKSIRTYAVAALLTLTTNPLYAGSPLATDDTGTVEVGKLEVELGGAYTYDSKNTGSAATRKATTDSKAKITTGLYKNMAIAMTIPYTITNRERVDGNLNKISEGFGDMTLEVKYQFAELNGTSFAIKPYTIVPTGKYSNGLSEGQWQYGTTLIATREFEEGKYAVHANLGYEHHDFRTDSARADNRTDLWSGSIAGEVRVFDGMTVVADFGLSSAKDRNSDELSAYSLIGARYEVSKNIDLNAGVKFGLTRPENDITVLYGLTLKI